jgi:16S rRNA (guanine527-N7)-methyltransferase
MSPDRIAELLTPYAAVSPEIAAQLALYLDLIEKWNARINLTAIRNPDDIVRRHFGESLFAAAHLPVFPSGPAPTLLDFGSGAVHVTLAESRSRKSAFLHEVVRTLALPTEIWPHRVEEMPDNRTFDAVALRAVDEMDLAIQAAAARASHRLLIFTTNLKSIPSILYDNFNHAQSIPIPHSTDAILAIFNRR